MGQTQEKVRFLRHRSFSGQSPPRRSYLRLNSDHVDLLKRVLMRQRPSRQPVLPTRMMLVSAANLWKSTAFYLPRFCGALRLCNTLRNKPAHTKKRCKLGLSQPIYEKKRPASTNEGHVPDRR